jgi:acyl transferase domain-containing protein/acyl carrier protein/NAD(P)-dependent dehydrogenase (short-subunit alcohol dehydrogenase family)
MDRGRQSQFGSIPAAASRLTITGGIEIMKVPAAERAVAIVGVGALLPDAPNAKKFWQNVREGRYSIKEVIPERWDPNSYYDPDPKAPDKTYSKIGGWVRDWEWDPLKWRLPIPPRVGMAMDLTQKWAVVTAREALSDYGYPSRPLNQERTAVILGNAMAGDTHLYSAARILFPEYAGELEKSPSYSSLPIQVRREIMEQLLEGVRRRMPPITEDTMPGELANIVAGRIAALYDFKGPNFVADAACASAMAAISAALEGLNAHDYDAVLTGGIDTNMSPSTFVKFCKIGALSATGTRPYAEGSDGFVMGEGAVTFLIKRLADAERDGDRIYAVIRGIGGSSDGKGKGITAPNPAGQKICIRRAWQNAGVAPSPGDLIEGHGTSTPVGDVAELESLSEVFNDLGLPRGSIALGSVKSNIGHLKGAAGAAGILKAMFALNQKELPPSLNFNRPNPNFDFDSSPFYVNTKLEPWEVSPGGVRRAAVSAFGFGGTNFHIVMEEYIPGRIGAEIKVRTASAETNWSGGSSAILKTPLRGALVIGAESESGIIARLRTLLKEAEAGKAPAPAPPFESDLRAEMRLSIDYANAAELVDKIGKALKAFEENQPARWKALRPKGIFIGKGPAPKVAFLFTGQGSQYVNMIKTLRETEPIVARVFEEADRTMTPLLGKSLTSCIYLDESDEAALAAAENGLKQTAITQPAVLATETALSKLLNAYGISPDMVMGHSLGEYGALVASGAISFEEALRAVSARGNEMTRCSLDDNGMMAAVFGPIDKIEKILSTVDDYVVIANINSSKEAVIGGTTTGVDKAMAAVRDAGFVARPLQVSHAFHTKIVAPAGESLAKILSSMNICPPAIPIISNVTGEFYPMGPGVVPEMISLLGRQVSSPVQFIKGLNTLYAAGARLFVEMGPKRILYGFVEDVLSEREDVVSLFTNHPRIGETTSVNLALCGLYAAGLGLCVAQKESSPTIQVSGKTIEPPVRASIPAPVQQTPSFNLPRTAEPPQRPVTGAEPDRYTELGRLFTEFLDRGFQIYSGGRQSPPPVNICITGAAVGLPGVDRVFDDSNVERILRGDVFIEAIPMNLRRAMVEKNITRLVKSESGEGRFESIENLSDVIKLAARSKDLDIIRDFGFPEERTQALDRVTKLAIGAGIDALRDAGIPLVMHYKTTTKGTKLPDRWMLPEEIRDDTGILFTSAFPGYDSYEQIISDFYKDRIRRERLEELNSLHTLALQSGNGSGVAEEIRKRMDALRLEIENNVYHFDRRFLFRVLSMGHSQFAEYIGARGPNTSTNGACASGTQAVGIASDWIRTGRCRRVVIISADDITSDNLMGWFGSGFLASGSAATDEIVEEAATPFDRRRHGLIIGMGASAIVMESLESARERGIRPICEVMGSVLANSAYHGTRLDVSHIRYVMERLIANAESEWGINRYQIAPETVFVSHETYTPARGGSASAEVFALRHVFKEAADQIIVANTKGATGHPMAVGIEDVVSVKILETGIVPAVPNFKEVDPELGYLNLSKGGSYPVRYALRLGAGFGSQICMTLLRWSPTPDGKRPSPSALGYQYRIENREAWNSWLKRLTGYDEPDLEVVQRTLRARDQGPAARINGNGMVAQIPSKPATLPVETAALAAIAAVAPVVAASPAAFAKDPVQIRVMQIIAEKTGYPTDMLDLDLDLEADLGIDTVKQAEMFAAIRAAYDIPREDTLKLRDFPTLAHAIQFVYDRRPDLKATAVSSSNTSAQEAKPSAMPVLSKGAGDAVQQEVLKIIAEKTGYPPDMLDLDLDLEADLGIDTVKQAEMFAAIRAAYDIPREDSLKLRDFPTLAHAIQFVYDRRPDLKPSDVLLETAPPQISTPSPAAETKAAGDAVQQEVLKIIAEKTGYPPDMLDLDLDLEADLGIDTVKQAEMFAAIRAAYDISREDTLKLRDFPTLAHAIQFVYDRRPDLKPAVATAAVSASASVRPVAPAKPVNDVPPPTGPDKDPVRAKVLEIIAEKTGYPSDMLDLDLDLEADLGIDTVKQAEMFAAIRAAYDIPREDTLKLRDYPTLAHTIQFVYDRKPELKRRGAVQPEAAQKPATESRGGSAPGPIAGSLEAANAIPRRVPSPQLRPPLALCKSTGISLQPGVRVIVMPDQGGIGKALVARLEKLGVQALVIDGAPDAKFLSKYIENWKAEGPIGGVYWLPALDSQGPIAALSFAQWREATRIRSKLLFTTMQALDDQAGEQGAFLISATRLGGLHGYDEAGAADPLGGAVTGFTKAYKREKDKAVVKVVDFELSRKTSALADLLIEETLRDPGAVEIGYRDGQRWTIGLKEKAANSETAGLELSKDSVFLITGAAGSIVSAITSDLAAASGGIFYLLDLTPEPDPRNSDLQRLVTDRENLKRDIFERLKLRGERATPAMVDRELAVLERSRAALDAIQAVKNAGGTAHYYSLDLLDNAAVDRVVRKIAEQHGRIDVLMHAAGLEISHRLPDKKPGEFDLVFDVKSDGWFNLISSIGGMPLGAAVVFSSVAGRFGNAGQTDYSSANDLLCKCMSSLRSTHPKTRGIAIDWTAWSGIGMAARGSIPAIMKQAGIDMLPPEAGIPIVRRELISGCSGEVVIGQKLGILIQEFDPHGGLDVSREGPLASLLRNRGIMTGEIVGMGLYTGLTVETSLDPAKQPFLYDHQINMTPVLPGVMGIEAMAEAAGLLFPERCIGAIEDVSFFTPFKFYRNQPRIVTVHVDFFTDKDEIIAECRLTGSRTLHGQTAPEITTHFAGRVRLAAGELQAVKEENPPNLDGETRVEAPDIYNIYFHGPAYQVIQNAWKSGEHIVGQYEKDLPDNHVPAELPAIAFPRLIELCFQTASLSGLAMQSKLGLPYGIRELKVFSLPENLDESFFAIITVNSDGSYDGKLMDGKGYVYLVLRGYKTMDLPDPVQADLLKPLQRALQAGCVV